MNTVSIPSQLFIPMLCYVNLDTTEFVLSEFELSLSKTFLLSVCDILESKFLAVVLIIYDFQLLSNVNIQEANMNILTNW